MSCICNQIFSTASMAINNGLPSIGLRLANLLNKYEAKKKTTIENLQKINNNNSNKGNNNSNKGNNNSNKGNNNSNKGNNNSNKGNNNSNKGNNNSNGSKLGVHDKINKIKKKIPPRLLNEDGTVNKNLFKIKVKRKVCKKEPKGFMIDSDTKNDGGSIWKLKDKDGNRICSLDDNGKILRP